MSYTKAHYTDVDPISESLYFLRDALDCENLGISVVDCDPNWTGKEHDHSESEHEEVYYLVRGGATLVVDGEEVELGEGDAIRVSPDTRRQIQNGPEHSQLVIAGAP